MLLHQDGIIELNYDVSSDILRVRWPNTKDATQAELLFSLERLLATVQNYDIKRLLIDARGNIDSMDDAAYEGMQQQFAAQLLTTRLQRVARIASDSVERLKIVNEIAEASLKQTGSKLRFQHFADVPTALLWLKQEVLDAEAPAV